MKKKIAVVFFNLGGPDNLAAVQPFLFNLFNDPAIIKLPNPIRFLLAKLISKRRAPLAQDIYKQIGGKSPLLELTQDQARSLDKKLNDGTTIFQTFIAMRYWKPFAIETAALVKNFAPDEIVLLPLYPQFSTTTTASSLKDWTKAAKAQGLNVPTHHICCYPQDDGLVDAYIDLAKPLIKKSFDKKAPVHLLLSAHGLPEKIVKAGDPYPDHVEKSAAAIVKGLKLYFGEDSFKHTVCYQSRVGPLKWIGPSTDDVIKDAGSAKESLVVLPIAFVSEHSETLVELDIEYKHLAKTHGVTAYYRVPAAGCHPAFIDGLAKRVHMALAGQCPRLCDANVKACACRS